MKILRFGVFGIRFRLSDKSYNSFSHTFHSIYLKFKITTTFIDLEFSLSLIGMLGLVLSS